MTFQIDYWKPNSEDLRGWWDDFWKNREFPFGPPSSNLMPFIENEISYMAPRRLSAIDIASGNGRYAIPMAKLGCEVTALEWTESGARVINEEARRHAVDIRIEQADFTIACETARDFDIVVCSGLLEEIDEVHHINAISGFANWTAPGGLSVIKYCIELEGRGHLVKENFVESELRNYGMEIVYVREKRIMEKSSATKMGSRTGTVIARRPNLEATYQ